MAVYKVTSGAGALKKNRFEFTLGEETLSLPRQEFMPADGEDYITEHAQRPEMSRRSYILGLIAAVDPAVGEKVDAARLGRDELSGLFEAWLESSAVDPGKS